MADFTFASAEARAYALVANGTWIEAFAARATTGGKYCVRVRRKMSAASPDNGAWIELTDDTQT